MAQCQADNGYATSELWGLGYQGNRCDLNADQTERSRIAHTNQANVPDLRRFVRAVLATPAPCRWTSSVTVWA